MRIMVIIVMFCVLVGVTLAVIGLLLPDNDIDPIITNASNYRKTQAQLLTQTTVICIDKYKFVEYHNRLTQIFGTDKNGNTIPMKCN